MTRRIITAFIIAAALAGSSISNASDQKVPKLALVASTTTPSGQDTSFVTTTLRWNRVPSVSAQLVCVQHVNCWDIGVTPMRYTLTLEVPSGATLTYWLVTCWTGRSECGNSNTITVNG